VMATVMATPMETTPKKHHRLPAWSPATIP